ncbi:MAG TPA: hypothetical protein VJQ25_08750 [Nitrospira sp.]|nr:hypothetical protein [Nitrospira sp.]
MKIIVVVLIVGVLLGGFIGGELSGKSFSAIGAVVGGIGLLLALNVYGAMIGRRAGGRVREGWDPRPFYKNQSKEQIKEWFAHVEPWALIDTRILDALIERLYGNPMFELFVLTSMEAGLVPQYQQFKRLFDIGVGDVAIYSQVANVLFRYAESNREHAIRILSSPPPDPEELKKYYVPAINALEASIHVEPLFLPSYASYAILRMALGKKEDALQMCQRGLARVDQLKAAPLPSRPDMDLKSGVDAAEQCLRDIMRDVSSS